MPDARPDAGPFATLAPGPPIACPDGTTIALADPPERRAFCAAPDGTRQGPFVELYPDGTVAASGTYVDGAYDGAFTRFHPGGAVAERGAYALGKKDGAWQQLAPDGTVLGGYTMKLGSGVERHWWTIGKLASETTWKDGVRNGRARAWNQDGVPLLDERWQGGVLDGDRLMGSKLSMLITETYRHGVRVGRRTLWQRGELIIDENYDSRGRLDGPSITWRDREHKREAGQYVHGKREGQWQWFDGDGNMWRQGSYTAGHREGEWLELKNGRVTWQGTYVGGLLDGDVVESDVAGREINRYHMQQGTGVEVQIWPTKKPSQKTTFAHGRMSGPYDEYFQDGKTAVEGTYRNDAKDGIWHEWNDSGQLLLEETYDAGKRVGPWRRWADDGSLVAEASYADGKRDGTYVEYFADGKRAMAGSYVDDVREGEWTQWYDDGSVAQIATWKAGVLDGPWEEMRPGGVTAVSGQLVAGRRAGTWRFFDPAGQLARTITYP